MLNNKFTIRVYGLLINENDEILITDEIYEGKRLTKFPGGGLEYGEGPIDYLKRECLEELGFEIEVKDHFYTTDFFQSSYFNNDYQVLCIYYFIKTKEKLMIETKHFRFDFPEESDGTIVFRWVRLSEILKEEFTFENDRRVAGMLFEKYAK
jgi:8-oxo-dGTP pyrophosphatase MutT (NUDIX family)